MQLPTEVSIQSFSAVRSSRFDRSLTTILVVGTLAILLFTGWYATLRNVNWDEFHFLSQVYDAIHHRPLVPIQTFHVQLFSWLAGQGSTEVDEINIARHVVFVFHLLTCGMLYRIARHRLARPAALFAVMSFAGFSFVVSHATSFRTDPFATFLILLSINCLLRRRFVGDIIAACAFGFAFALTIKAVLFVPGVIGVVVYRHRANDDKWRNTILSAVRLLLITFIVAAGAIAFNAHRLGLEATHAVSQTTTVSAGAGRKVLHVWPLFPRSDYAVFSLKENLATWGLMLVSIGLLIRSLVSKKQRTAGLWLAAVLSPLASLIFYRNAFPYFYVMLMPFGALAAAEVFSRVRESYQRKPKLVLATLLLICPIVNLVSLITAFGPRLFDQQAAQREQIALAHAMFPDPVPYIDRNSTVSRFPKVGFFMSSWGVENYRAANAPIFERVLKQRQPRFLIANCKALEIDGEASSSRSENPRTLFDEDREVLSNSFVQFWGRLFVAGKRFDTLPLDTPTSFELLVGGPYVLEGSSAVELDGQPMQVGEVRLLNPGNHTIRGLSHSEGVILRIQTAVERPQHAPSRHPFYFGLAM